MIKITHEFPLQFYLDGTAEKLTDYDYCLVHRYLDTPEYAEYMRNAVQKGRTVYLDNSLYELGSAWNNEDYVKVIKELKPTYYMLPDVFAGGPENMNSQLGFLSLYKEELEPSIAIAIPHSTSLTSLGLQLSKFCELLPKEVMIAIPFGDNSFKNTNDEVGYFNSKDVAYEPLRMALNRKMFLKTQASTLRDRKIHLLGCKSLAEFDKWNSNFDKSNIVSLDTSHPVALTLEGPCNTYKWGFFNPDQEDKGIKMAMHFYKPTFLIDKHFYETGDVYNNNDIVENIEYFQNYVRDWARI